jgi:hypothetical protein
LGGINIALAVFHVLQAAPPDGERLLGSIIKRWSGDRLKVTQWSSRTGQVCGEVLLALGLCTFFTGGAFGGLWLVLIGRLLVGVATAESQQVTVCGLLGRLGTRDGMTANLITAPQSTTVEDLLDMDMIRPGTRHSR